MLSGECRIDAIPVNGQAVLIDGLRLRLDLRLAPAAGAAKASPQQRTGSALLPRRVQRLAAVAGLGALLTALAFWFAGGTSSPPLPAPVRPAAAPPPVETALPQLAPVPQVVPVTPEVRPVVEPPVRLAPPAAPAEKPVPAVAKSPAVPRASAPKPPAASAPAARRPPVTDLDLFGDTK